MLWSEWAEATLYMLHPQQRHPVFQRPTCFSALSCAYLNLMFCSIIILIMKAYAPWYDDDDDAKAKPLGTSLFFVDDGLVDKLTKFT